MSIASHSVGFVYVLTNGSMPGVVKVGLTSWLPEDRAKDLFTTGVPEPFHVAYRSATSRRDVVERKAHALLDAYRVSPNREFFRVSVESAIEAVRLAMVEVAGIESWRSPTRHLINSQDRLALTLESGQMFTLLAYRDLSHVMMGRAEPIDVWQAHSDADLLEIFGTESAGQVAGFSDNDPGGTIDPVPYLDRQNTVANGFINGRERLMPGDRLVWIPAPERADAQASVVFEAREYCQVVSRTWSPKFDSNGLPLLLNHFTYGDPWPAASRSIQEALALSPPRSWAPREDRDASWERIGVALPAPEHWLPQLRRRSRKT